MEDDRLSAEHKDLGLGRAVTRRDFVNGAAAGAGIALLSQSAPALASRALARGSAPGAEALAFDGTPGSGDYARSHGNIWNVIQAAHATRDGEFASLANVEDTGETYDVVVVGGGFSGMGAAYKMLKETGGKKSCLVLENHPLWGGEAKRNEILVDGVRLMGPQGSNDFGVPNASSAPEISALWDDLGLPREFTYSSLAATRKQLPVSITNFDHQIWSDTFESHGFWFGEQKRWVTNPWGHELAGVPWSDDLKREMLRWRSDMTRYYTGEPGEPYYKWLDSMTYEDYLTKVVKLPVEVARYADPILAASGGLGCDTTSAYLAAMKFALPGFQGVRQDRYFKANHSLSVSTGQRFPGGNDGIMRAFVKKLVPSAIAGGTGFAEVHNGAIRFDKLDEPGTPVRLRLASMTVDVRHEGPVDKSGSVAVTYLRDGRLHRVRARAVVVASGSWVAKHIVQALPKAHLEALGSFYRSPVLVLNVALRNWRPLYNLGYTAASWRGGFGFTFNVAPPMQVGDYAAPFDPDKPVMITFYVPVIKPGLPVEEQGPVARAEILATPYRDYELQVRRQLTEMLGAHGFDARRDIAGIVLNRWGHAYVDPYPGFFFGKDGKAAPPDVVRRPFGRISFGHSEFEGHQSWTGAVTEGSRAMDQALARL